MTDEHGAPAGLDDVPDGDAGPSIAEVVNDLRAELDDLARAKAVREHARYLGQCGTDPLLVAEHRDALVAAKLTTKATFDEALRAGRADARQAARDAKADPHASPAPVGEPAAPTAFADLTDDANARALVAANADRMRRVSDMTAWWWWTGRRWERDHDDAHVREAAKQLARVLPQHDEATRTHKRNSMSSAGLTAAVRVAQSDPRITLLARDLDRHPELLNTPSGVLDLRHGTLAAHNPDLLLTRITDYPVDLDASHPLWDAFLAETFCEAAGTAAADSLTAYVQRLCGLALLGDVRDHVLPFLYGAGANGKGVLLLILQGLLGVADTGGYALSAPDGFLMTNTGAAHPTEIARLRGARLVVASEQTSGKRFDEARVKRLTGGDLLTGRFMRGDFFDFAPSHLITVASNHLPAVREGGPSFWRRVRLIPFDHVVPPERRNPELHAELLATEGPAILAWMARGAADVIRLGLRDPKRVTDATRAYETSEDALASFVQDECLTGEAHWCSVADFRTRFEAHCAQMGLGVAEIPSAKAVTMRLTREFGATAARLAKGRRIYQGISLCAREVDQDG
jgi:putative DNA primase/helicase